VAELAAIAGKRATPRRTVQAPRKLRSVTVMLKVMYLRSAHFQETIPEPSARIARKGPRQPPLASKNRHVRSHVSYPLISPRHPNLVTGGKGERRCNSTKTFINNYNTDKTYSDFFHYSPSGQRRLAVSAPLVWSKLKTSRSKIPVAPISTFTKSQIAASFGGPCSESFGGPGEPSHIQSLTNTIAEISSRSSLLL
jgi:hypothetical protein